MRGFRRQATGDRGPAARRRGGQRPRGDPASCRDGRIINTRVTPDRRSFRMRDADDGHPALIAPGDRRIRTPGDVQPTGV